MNNVQERAFVVPPSKKRRIDDVDASNGKKAVIKSGGGILGEAVRNQTPTHGVPALNSRAQTVDLTEGNVAYSTTLIS